MILFRFFLLIASRKNNSAFSCLDSLLFHNMSPFIVVLCVSYSNDARNFKKIHKFAFIQKEILWQVFHNTCQIYCVQKIFCFHCSYSVNKELLPERTLVEKILNILNSLFLLTIKTCFSDKSCFLFVLSNIKKLFECSH